MAHGGWVQTYWRDPSGQWTTIQAQTVHITFSFQVLPPPPTLSDEELLAPARARP